MKTSSVIKCLCLLCCFWTGCSVPYDENEEKNKKEEKTTTDLDDSDPLPWLGDTDKFILNKGKGIQLKDPEKKNGIAYLSTPLTSIRDQRWAFSVSMTFKPTVNNFARFYLSSTSSDLKEATSGYFIQIGGEDETVSLCREYNGECTLLAAGRNLLRKNSSPKIDIKVECDQNGTWRFWTRSYPETDYLLENKVSDTSITKSACCGFLCVYTSSRCNGFTFHHIHLSNRVEVEDPNEKPPTPTNPEEAFDLPENPRNRLLFNEIMYHHKTIGAEYVELYNPSDTTLQMAMLYLGKLREDGTYMSKTVLNKEGAKLYIAGHGYLCFTKSIEALVQTHQISCTDNIIEIPNFPELNNSNGILVLTSSDHRLIDKCRFGNFMQTVETKSYKGIAIEKKSPELPSYNANWRSCMNETGGTPGR